MANTAGAAGHRQRRRHVQLAVLSPTSITAATTFACHYGPLAEAAGEALHSPGARGRRRQRRSRYNTEAVPLPKQEPVETGINFSGG